MERIQHKASQTFLPSILFLTTAYFAGSKRFIHHFPKATSDSLFYPAVLGSGVTLGSWMACPNENKKRRKLTIFGFGCVFVITPFVAKTLKGNKNLNHVASIRFVALQGILFGSIEIACFKPTARPLSSEESINLLPISSVSEICLYLNISDIPATSLSCSKFNNAVQTSKVQSMLIEQISFGSKDWQQLFGNVGDVPRLTENIFDIMKAECPFRPGYLVRHTHMLVLIPKTVNGKFFTLNLLQELTENHQGKFRTSFDSYNWYVKQAIGNTGVRKSYWVLMTKDVIPYSQREQFGNVLELYTEQKQLVIEKGSKIYEIPSALEAATSILMNYFKTGEVTYKSPTYTNCKEIVFFPAGGGRTSPSEQPVSLGRFSPKGIWPLGLSKGIGIDDYWRVTRRTLGVAAIRFLNQETIQS